jgi:hypothetical protein
MAEASSHAVPPYGPAIHQAIGRGDLEQMRKLAESAKKWLSEHGDVSAALEALKAEIARREAAKS